MSFVLLAIGLLAAAIGAIMVGFGIPINEFSLGNTLIIAGTTALMGGLIVIGLALVLRQLINLTETLSARPVSMGGPAGRPASESSEPAPPRAAAPRMPMPVPARPDMAPPRPPRGPESLVAEAPEVPASPRGRPPAPAPADDALDMPSWRPSRPAPEPVVPRKEGQRVPPPLAARERRSTEAAYDAIWPNEGRASPPDRIDAHPPEPRVSAGAESTSSDAAHNSRPEPVSVLKSGVVDGMAYTLYTDGSIEAELAQGVVRFGSIEELRNHLEKSAS